MKEMKIKKENAVMNKIEQLIAKVQSDESEVSSAISQLAAMGMLAVPAILDAIRKNPERSNSALRETILQMHDPKLVDVFIELIHNDDINLVMTAFKGLGQSGDKRAMNPLIDYLLAPDNLETYRSLAASALGELGHREAIASLLKTTDEAIKDDMPKLAISTVIALAKLGNHDKASIAIALTRYKDDPIIRANAAEALQYSIGPGMFSALQGALHDNYFEVRLSAVDAMFYLGVREAIHELISSTNDDDESVANNALVRLRELTGERFVDPSMESLSRWWHDHGRTLQEMVCYRLGRPLWIPDIIAALEKPDTRMQVCKELKIITGKDFGFNPEILSDDQNDLQQRAQSWWEEGQHFERGQLYKYGYKQDIRDIF
jgi:HEAT repeat protein